MDREEAQHLLQDLHRPLQKCQNNCYCKRCCYHCQLCFLQKGLGVNYAPRIRRKKTTSASTISEHNQSISTRGGNNQTTQEGTQKVEKSTGTDQGPGRKNLEHKTGKPVGARD
uniref:Protein Tat n=1 Tax=Simian immunodeficiency virus TaxID=11723 RepID=A0A161CZU0_SIV|nr:tat protein [Simian immunodeficiency virus]